MARALLRAASRLSRNPEAPACMGKYFENSHFCPHTLAHRVARRAVSLARDVPARDRLSLIGRGRQKCLRHDYQKLNRRVKSISRGPGSPNKGLVWLLMIPTCVGALMLEAGTEKLG